MTERRVRRGALFTITAATCVGPEIVYYIGTLNAVPSSFRRIKSADDILATIGRFCEEILETPDHQNTTGAIHGVTE